MAIGTGGNCDVLSTVDDQIVLPGDRKARGRAGSGDDRDARRNAGLTAIATKDANDQFTARIGITANRGRGRSTIFGDRVSQDGNR